jgi:DNA processing protein
MFHGRKRRLTESRLPSGIAPRLEGLSTEEASRWLGFLGWKLDATYSTRSAFAGKDPVEVLSRLLSRPTPAQQLFAASPGPELPAGVLVPSGFPPRLREMSTAPHLLWTAGDTGLLGEGRPRVGIIGSRRPRPDSVTFARGLARQLAQAGVVVVSGLAVGIDGVAHQGAVEERAPTIAVLASGIDRPYPSRHRQLAHRILEHGGVWVSEYGPGLDAYKQRFRDRNRIIAALSDFLVVVQAGARSGSMITARHALELGVDLGVVPSFIGDPAYEGSLGLLRDGARAVVDAGSVLSAMGVQPKGSAEQHGFGTILDVPRSADELAGLSGLGLAATLDELLELELSGVVERFPDGRYVNAVISAVQ